MNSLNNECVKIEYWMPLYWILNFFKYWMAFIEHKCLIYWTYRLYWISLHFGNHTPSPEQIAVHLEPTDSAAFTFLSLCNRAMWRLSPQIEQIMCALQETARQFSERHLKQSPDLRIKSERSSSVLSLRALHSLSVWPSRWWKWQNLVSPFFSSGGACSSVLRVLALVNKVCALGLEPVGCGYYFGYWGLGRDSSWQVWVIFNFCLSFHNFLEARKTGVAIIILLCEGDYFFLPLSFKRGGKLSYDGRYGIWKVQTG